MDPDVQGAVERQGSETLPIVKAHLIGAEIQTSNQVSRSEEQEAFHQAGALEPPYDPEMLCSLFEHSNSLRPNVDAYATNIDGFGYTLVPVIDLDDDDADARIACAIMAEGDAKPSEDEVKRRREELVTLMATEKTKVELFFEACAQDASQDISFVTLRRRSRQDLEVMGNAYWEVLRNKKGAITDFVYIPGYTVRLMPLDTFHTPCRSKVKISEIDYVDAPRRRKFRRFVQIVDTRVVIFKEMGDPRIISSETGAVFETVEALRAAEPTAAPATEILHFKIHSPRSAYGVPRWIGNLLSVLGSRQAEEVNFLYFENKSVPPLAVLVSGGRISPEAVKRIEEYVQVHIKGKRNFHRILVLEAEPAQGASPDSASKMKIQLVPLLGAQHSDALFQGYDASNIDKVGSAFRLPRMLRGDIRDFNRSTADAALTFAEMQVFQPEREEFDFLMNRKVLPELGVRCWRFRSLAPITRDPAVMAQMIKDLVNANVLTPEEGRALAADVFNRDFKKIKEPWVRQPVPLTLAGFANGGDTSGMPKNTTDPQNLAVRPMGGRRPNAKGLVEEALRLLAVKKIYAHAQEEIAKAERESAKKAELEEDVVRIPAEEMERLLHGDARA